MWLVFRRLQGDGRQSPLSGRLRTAFGTINDLRFGRRKATSTAQTGAGGSLNFTQPISESDPTSQLKTNDFRGITLR